MTLTLRTHIDQLISELRQSREIPIRGPDGNISNVTIDTRNFSTYFLTSNLTQSINQYGIVQNSWSTYVVQNSWHNHEIPYYDNEQRYTPSETVPPPETSQAADWEEFTDIRCEVATRFVNNLLDTIINTMQMLVDEYITAMDCVKIICDALVDIFLVASVALTVTGVGAGASTITIPLGLTAKVILEIAAIIQKYLISTTLSLFTSALENEKKRAALICGIYKQKTPEGILNGWKSAVEEEFSGILYWPIQQILKLLMENRHALALAEGVGKRSLGAECGGCVDQCFSFVSSYIYNFKILEDGHTYNRSVITPDGVVFQAKPGYPQVFTKPANAHHWTWRASKSCYLGGSQCRNLVLYAKTKNGDLFWAGLWLKRFFYKPNGGSWSQQQLDWSASPCSIVQVAPETQTFFETNTMPPGTIEFMIFYEAGNENRNSPNKFAVEICKA